MGGGGMQGRTSTGGLNWAGVHLGKSSTVGMKWEGVVCTCAGKNFLQVHTAVISKRLHLFFFYENSYY